MIKLGKNIVLHFFKYLFYPSLFSFSYSKYALLYHAILSQESLKLCYFANFFHFMLQIEWSYWPVCKFSDLFCHVQSTVNHMQWIFNVWYCIFFSSRISVLSFLWFLYLSWNFHLFTHYIIFSCSSLSIFLTLSILFHLISMILSSVSLFILTNFTLTLDNIFLLTYMLSNF